MLPLSPETEALVRAKALMAGKTPDQIIQDALAEWTWKPDMNTSRVSVDRQSLARILAELDAMPVRDRRSAREILDEAWGL